MAQVSNYDLPRRLSEGCCPTLGELLSTRFFKALCDPNRLGILTQLATSAQPTTVTEVAGCCPVDLSVVSRHLKTLFDAGIVSAERSGREVRYSVRFADVAETLRAIADAIEACCPAGACSAAAPPPEPAKPTNAARQPRPSTRTTATRRRKET